MLISMETLSIGDRQPLAGKSSGPGNLDGLRHHWAFGMFIRCPSPPCTGSWEEDGWDEPRQLNASVSSATTYDSPSDKDECQASPPSTQTSLNVNIDESPQSVVEHATPASLEVNMDESPRSAIARGTPASLDVNMNESPRSIVFTPFEETCHNPDDVFGPTAEIDTGRCFLGTAADYRRYAANMGLPRKLCQWPKPGLHPDRDLQVDCRLEKLREARLQRRARRGQHSGLKKVAKQEDETDFDHQRHSNPSTAQPRQEGKLDDSGSSGTAAGDNKPFVWWW
ncbi:hypothetical protein QBC40DRAFT_301529 [Triangularia verruculosa]|uniref:Uncharacterized protein n=1 Tax=Triangularia verruculosa TaxID=2587418 RepID=A0AAN6X7F7_9PEZI|nr:hypothetical protein QBC40DRAFT_301529 [Triangularia verruculosa]